jgi:hypothetical protein
MRLGHLYEGAVPLVLQDLDAHHVAVRPEHVEYCANIRHLLSHTKLKKIKSVLGAPYPYVFGPPGSASGSVSHKYGSGSGNFHHQAKVVIKNLISAVL